MDEIAIPQPQDDPVDEACGRSGGESRRAEEPQRRRPRMMLEKWTVKPDRVHRKNLLTDQEADVALPPRSRVRDVSRRICL
jgi:hypothetical protein